MSEQPSPSELYINRELSWLEFNHRVFEEARSASHPLLERVKFLAITSSNLDEFVMIRVSGLQQQIAAGQGGDMSPDGMTATEQLAEVRARVVTMQTHISDHWRTSLHSALAAEGIQILDYGDLDGDQVLELREYYEREIFPILTPLAIDPGHPFPHISNLSMNLAIVVDDPIQGRRFSRMKIPGSLPRLVPCKSAVARAAKSKGGSESATERVGCSCFVWIEQVVAANLDTLFRGLDVRESYPFRVTRNADIEIQEDEASDLLRTIEEGLRQRQFGAVARLEIDLGMPDELRQLLTSNLLLDAADVVEMERPLGIADVMDLLKVERSELKDAPLVTHVPPELVSAVDDRKTDDLFAAIGEHDILLHHPYDSFRPVVAFVEGAAHDSNVQAIKQTLYRVGSRSPIVRALAQARDDDTQVAVLVELKARFDEENNIEWARALEDAGVHVVYGLLGLKTHCKMTLIVRKEPGGLRRYLHLGTGNYNPTTARIYTDFSLFTVNEELAADVSELFNLLTGYSRQTEYRKLLVAPVNMRQRLTALIENEAHAARQGRPARLLFKMNSLVDPDMICSLYDASRAGVKIDLIIRGISCLRPGVEGMSENIRVVSIVGRFLEHSRAYYFENGGEGGEAAALYLGSADIMQRNLDRRVEVLFPIEDAELRRSIRDDILEMDLRDTLKSWELQPDGSWTRVARSDDAEPISAQLHFLDVRREIVDSDAGKIQEVKFAPASIFPKLPV
jgi:polyphosphate kinase